MRIFLVRSFCLVVLLLFTWDTALAAAVPQQSGFDEKATREEVAAMFADAPMAEKARRETKEWLLRAKQYAADPDARLFYFLEWGEPPVDGDQEYVAGPEVPPENQLRRYKFAQNAIGSSIMIDASPEPLHNSYTFAYAASRSGDGSLWCRIESRTSDKYGYSADNTVMRLHNGVISNLTPEKPKEEEFYRRGKLPPYPKKMDAEIHGCTMAVVFSAGDSAPFSLTATLEQVNAGDSYDSPAYECIPECSIPYAWSGKHYARGKPDCLPKGKWGIFPPKK